MYLVLTFLCHWGIILRTYQVQFGFHRDYEQGQCGGEGPHIHTPLILSIVCRFYYKHCPLTFQTQRHLISCIVFDSKRLINPAGNPVRKQTNMKLLFCISHPTKNECIYKHPFIYFPSVFLASTYNTASIICPGPILTSCPWRSGDSSTEARCLMVTSSGGPALRHSRHIIIIYMRHS